MPEQIVINNEEPTIAIIENKRTENFANVNMTQLYFMDVLKFLDSLPKEPIFDLVVTSPPYNIGKEYEKQMPLDEYVRWQKRIIDRIYIRLKDTGSICWQVGNYVENGSITPLDIELAPIFKKLNINNISRIKSTIKKTNDFSIG
jgi:adenine-specific DNA-methyltransferase